LNSFDVDKQTAAAETGARAFCEHEIALAFLAAFSFAVAAATGNVGVILEHGWILLLTGFHTEKTNSWFSLHGSFVNALVTYYLAFLWA